MLFKLLIGPRNASKLAKTFYSCGVEMEDQQHAIQNGSDVDVEAVPVA